MGNSWGEVLRGGSSSTQRSPTANSARRTSKTAKATGGSKPKPTTNSRFGFLRDPKSGKGTPTVNSRFGFLRDPTK